MVSLFDTSSFSSMSSFPWENTSIETWLHGVVSSCTTGDDITSKEDKLKEFLFSKESNESLQYPIYELLGEKSFDAIETLLNNRERIVSALLHNNDQEERFSDHPQSQEKSENNYSAPLSNSSRYIHTETVNGTWYTVEATKRARPRISHVPISTLPEWSRRCFVGCDTLNDIQSVVYDATQTHDNLLICAPTGSGKTNVALLTIINELKTHLSYHKRSPPSVTSNSAPFLIVYLTPMKALATEITSKLSSSLRHLKVVVKEYTGDTRIPGSELDKSHVLVATPEKWDVATRRGGEGTLSVRLKLLIIDEIHLLQDARGPVIEALVARTLRQVEQTQSMIRIVGLSATLPNCHDVAKFLRVPDSGLFIFGPEFRPVPLAMTLVGAKNTNSVPSSEKDVFEELYKPGRDKDSIQIDCIAIQLLKKIISEGKQVLVFVHTRGETSKFANLLTKYVQIPINHNFNEQISHKNIQSQLKECLLKGVGIHHAGLPRNERIFVENSFRNNSFSVLICTATLAWGVNLPAHTVIIKDTKVYNQEYGGYENIGILDVHQMFGRAGRPQFDTDGHAILIATSSVLQRYTTTLVNAEPINSKFNTRVEDFLNAEISLGTVTCKSDAMNWLRYTFMYQRDPDDSHYSQLLDFSINELTDNLMIRSSIATESLHPTHLGQVASLHYIPFTAVCHFNEKLRSDMSESELLDCVFSSGIFQSLLVRRTELHELENYKPLLPLLTPFDELSGKVNILFQSYVSRYNFKTPSLSLDQAWLADNMQRIFDAIFELTIEQGWCFLSKFSLNLCKMVDHQMWWCEEKREHPLKQVLTGKQYIPIFKKLERLGLSISELKEMSLSELKTRFGSEINARTILDASANFPVVEIYGEYQPIKENVNLINIDIRFPFEWDKSIVRDNELFWLFVQEPDGSAIYHSQEVYVDKRLSNTGLRISTLVPMSPTKSYILSITSDRYLGVEDSYFLHIEEEEHSKSHETYFSQIKELQHLKVTIFSNEEIRKRFQHIQEFNSIQTQLFYQAYHTDESLLLCSPPKTGKTIISELAISRMLERDETSKAIFIIPFKSTLQNIFKDFCQRYQCLVEEIIGDFSEDYSNFHKSRILFSTPERFDSFSRHSINQKLLNKVSILILDEFQLLGTNRGHIYETIISRMRFLTENKIRLIALSSPLSNPIDVGQYLCLPIRSVYNFAINTRNIPLMIFIRGFPGRQYCSRMAAMNKPLSDAILQYSKGKPTLVFVSSRKQTILTATDLISIDHNYNSFIRITTTSIKASQEVEDKDLSHFLTFGVGIYHGGLSSHDC